MKVPRLMFLTEREGEKAFYADDCKNLGIVGPRKDFRLVARASPVFFPQCAAQRTKGKE